jgi:hypothetical protein
LEEMGSEQHRFSSVPAQNSSRNNSAVASVVLKSSIASAAQILGASECPGSGQDSKMDMEPELVSIREDSPAVSVTNGSDISDDEARAEQDRMEQAEFDKLEAALDRTFGQSAPRALPAEDATFFDDPMEDAFRLYEEKVAPVTKEAAVPRSPSKRALARRAVVSREIDDGRREIERRLNEMKQTEIDQVHHGFQCSIHPLIDSSDQLHAGQPLQWLTEGGGDKIPNVTAGRYGNMPFHCIVSKRRPTCYKPGPSQAQELVRDWHDSWCTMLQTRISVTDASPLSRPNGVSTLLDTK